MVQSDLGNRTFLTPGRARFRFYVVGKSARSQGYQLCFAAISLEPRAGFTLVAPNGSCWPGSCPLLTWISCCGDGPLSNHHRRCADGHGVRPCDPVFQPKSSDGGPPCLECRGGARGSGRQRAPTELAFVGGVAVIALSVFGNSGMTSVPLFSPTTPCLGCACHRAPMRRAAFALRLGLADAVRRHVRLGMEEGEVYSILASEVAQCPSRCRF